MQGKQRQKYEGTFAFSDGQLRFDRTFDYDRPPTREVISGEYYYEHLAYESDSGPNGVPNVYVRGSKGKGPFYGEVIDIKRLMEPEGPRLDDLCRAVEAGTANAETEEQPGGTVKATLSSAKRVGEDIILWFDPSKGFALVREQFRKKGNVSRQIERTFAQIDGVWVMKSLKSTKYAEAIDASVQPLVKGTLELTFKNVRLNEKIADETFTLQGMGLRPKTRVWDTLSGVNYTLDPLQGILQQVERIMNELKANVPKLHAASVASATSEPVAAKQIAKPTMVLPVAKALVSVPATSAQPRAILVYGAGVIALLLVLLCCRFRWHRWGRAAREQQR